MSPILILDIPLWYKSRYLSVTENLIRFYKVFITLYLKIDILTPVLDPHMDILTMKPLLYVFKYHLMIPKSHGLSFFTTNWRIYPSKHDYSKVIVQNRHFDPRLGPNRDFLTIKPLLYLFKYVDTTF